MMRHVHRLVQSTHLPPFVVPTWWQMCRVFAMLTCYIEYRVMVFKTSGKICVCHSIPLFSLNRRKHRGTVQYFYSPRLIILDEVRLHHMLRISHERKGFQTRRCPIKKCPYKCSAYLRYVKRCLSQKGLIVYVWYSLWCVSPSVVLRKLVSAAFQNHSQCDVQKLYHLLLQAHSNLRCVHLKTMPKSWVFVFTLLKCRSGSRNDILFIGYVAIFRVRKEIGSRIRLESNTLSW